MGGLIMVMIMIPGVRDMVCPEWIKWQMTWIGKMWSCGEKEKKKKNPLVSNENALLQSVGLCANGRERAVLS